MIVLLNLIFLWSIRVTVRVGLFWPESPPHFADFLKKFEYWLQIHLCVLMKAIIQLHMLQEIHTYLYTLFLKRFTVVLERVYVNKYPYPYIRGFLHQENMSV